MPLTLTPAHDGPTRSRRAYGPYRQQSRWRRRLAILAVFLAVLVAHRVIGGLAVWLQAVLWLCLLAGATLYLRRHPIRLLGPVLPYDLVRTARQRRFFMLRAVYATMLLLVLAWIYVSSFRAQGGLAVLLQGGAFDIHETAAFAEAFFLAFSGVQYLAVLLFTPVYVAGAIIEEKDRRTLEYMLTTDLLSREIVVGKLLARISHLFLVLLAGLPLLACMESLGGVDPQLVVAGFLLTGITVISVGSLCVLTAIRARRALEAVFWSYVWLTLLFIGTLLIEPVWHLLLASFYMVSPSFGVWVSSTWIWVWQWLPTPEANTLGNPLLAIQFLNRRLGGGDNATVVLTLLQDYAFYHGLLALFCCYRASRTLRAVALRVDAPKPLWRRPGFDFPPKRRRRKLSERPLLWKEVHGEAPLGSEKFSALLFYFYLVLGWVLAGFYVFVIICQVGLGDFGELGATSHGLAAAMGNFLAIVLLAAVAVCAAGAVSRERERGTLDGLLTMPVTSDAILFAKWLGSVLSVRPVAVCLMFIWAIALLTGGLHILAMPLILIAWLCYAAFLSALGLFLSVYLGSTLRAVVWTFVTIVALTIGCRLMGTHGGLFFDPWLPPEAARAVALFFEWGLAPFTALYVLSFNQLPASGAAADRFLSALAGISCYAAAAWQLGRLTRRMFCAQANRDPRPGQARTLALSGNQA